MPIPSRSICLMKEQALWLAIVSGATMEPSTAIPCGSSKRRFQQMFKKKKKAYQTIITINRNTRLLIMSNNDYIGLSR
jgi:hypothetical protein